MGKTMPEQLEEEREERRTALLLKAGLEAIKQSHRAIEDFLDGAEEEELKHLDYWLGYSEYNPDEEGG